MKNKKAQRTCKWESQIKSKTVMSQNSWKKKSAFLYRQETIFRFEYYFVLGKFF